MKLKPLKNPDHIFVVASMTRGDAGVEELGDNHRFRGYAKIAVHYVIRKDGTVEQGRPLDEPGALAGRRNSHAIQVCVVGGVNQLLCPSPTFTDAQYAAISRLEEQHDLPVVFSADFPT